MVDEMQVYKVGGCIRDKLLGIPVTDNDFVVVGSTPEEMTRLGFKPVGNDFPVFLHPQTHEEYALARSEKKIATGYRGFAFQATPNISLNEDLKRRDITINAIAEDETGLLIDPFDGMGDLKKKIIRHVSSSFVEDPLRVLRVARFSAKLNFKVADDTLELMQQISESGEIKTLSSERIWAEIHKALMTKHAGVFFKILDQVGALTEVLPEVIPMIRNQDAFDKYQNLTRRMHDADYTIDCRFAMLSYFISNEYTQSETKTFINNACISNKCKHLALLLTAYYNPIRIFNNLSCSDVDSLVSHVDPIRRKERYVSFIDLVYMIAVENDDNKTRSHIELLKKIIDRISRIKYEKLMHDDPDSYIANIRKHKLKIIEDIVFALPES